MRLQVALLGGALVGSSAAWANETPVDVRGCFTSEMSVIDRAGDVVGRGEQVLGDVDGFWQGAWHRQVA